MVSSRLPLSKSSRPFYNPFVTVPKAPIPIGIIVTFMFHFHSFCNSLARSMYLSLFSHSFIFILRSAGTAKPTILQILIFLLIIIRSSFLSEYYYYHDFTPLSQCDSKSPRVSRTLLSILVDLNNAVVWMVSIYSPISNSSNLLLYDFGDRSQYANYNWYHC